MGKCITRTCNICKYGHRLNFHGRFGTAFCFVSNRHVKWRTLNTQDKKCCVIDNKNKD